MLTQPLAPDCVDPVPMYKAPVLPKLAVPVLNTNRPLTPDSPALAVVINIAPLEYFDP